MGCGREFNFLIQARSAIPVTAKSVRNPSSEMLHIPNLINSFAKPICSFFFSPKNSHQMEGGKRLLSCSFNQLLSLTHPCDWETITAIFHDNHTSALPSLSQAETQQAWLIWPICSADYAVYRTLNLSQLHFSFTSNAWFIYYLFPSIAHDDWTSLFTYHCQLCAEV